MARSGYHRSGDDLVDALARTRPKRVTVRVGDEAHDVACAGARVRWRDVAATVRALADGEAARVEMRDAEGAIVGVVAVPARDAAPATDAVDAAPLDARDERVLSLLVSAQRAALEEQRVLLAPVLDSYTQLAKGYAEYAAQVVELVRVAARVREELAEGATSPADAAIVSIAERIVGRPTTAPATNKGRE